MNFDAHVYPQSGPDRFRRGQLLADGRAAGQARLDFDSWLQTHFAMSAVSRSDVTLAVSEAVANAAEHAYFDSGSGPGTFDVDANYDNVSHALTVEVVDRGQWQTASGNTAPDRPRGRGIQLMHALSDHASIRTSANGTRVCLTWLRLLRRAEA